MTIQQQRGMGLIEVMVALLLLAIAVLGFSALQMHAVGATDESLVRTRATSVVRSLSEIMREHVDYLAEMQAVLNNSSGTTFNKDCLSVACDSQEMAQFAAKEVKDRAAAEGFSNVSLQVCPGTTGTQTIYCAIIAWGNTNAVLSDTRENASTKTINCANSNGIYHRGSTCLIMETY